MTVFTALSSSFVLVVAGTWAYAIDQNTFNFVKETPPIVAASGALCTWLRQTLPAKDNALGFTNRNLGGLMFWVGLRERLMAFSESIERREEFNADSLSESFSNGKLNNSSIDEFGDFEQR
nr:hypothetical protein Iba_chr09eCG13880 [Ipomoea batatas]